MMNKKIGLIFFIALIVVLLIGFVVLRYLGFSDTGKDDNATMVEEYTPEAEISDEQVRQTIVSLYFPLKDGDGLNPEARLIDIKEIINSPYEKLVSLLMDGPKNDKNKGVFPGGVKLNNVYLENDCVVLDFSYELLDYCKRSTKDKELLIDSVVNTLTELSEVNSVKILIDGKESDVFADGYCRKSDSVSQFGCFL